MNFLITALGAVGVYFSWFFLMEGVRGSFGLAMAFTAASLLMSVRGFGWGIYHTAVSKNKR